MGWQTGKDTQFGGIEGTDPTFVEGMDPVMTDGWDGIYTEGVI
jgi:hypothetical protein